MKIYYQYSNNKTLSPTRGDFINEIGTIIALSKFADVYYSGNFFDKKKKNYGLKQYRQSIEKKMLSQNYDVYYIRNNPVLFKKIPKKKLKIYFCSPYDESAFGYADFIATTTKAWSEYLMAGKYILKLNPDSRKFKSESFYQTIFDCYNTFGNEKTKSIRDKIGGDFVVGSFGRIAYSDNPRTVLSAVNLLNKNNNSIKLAISISNKNKVFNNNNVAQFNFSHNQMKFAYSSCNVVVASYCGPSWDFAGSLKTIESATCGTPVVLGRGEAREELFGKDYELFVDKEIFRNNDEKSVNILYDKILSIKNDTNLLKDISCRLLEKAKFYSVSESSKRLESIINKYI